MADSPSKRSATISGELDGARLDQALSLLAPELSLRGRKRLLENARVTLDGQPVKKGQRVAAGQLLVLEEGRGAEGEVRGDSRAVAVLARTRNYAALAKPNGLHTAALAGSDAPSLEGLLSDLFPDETAPFLANRLDRATSGIVLAVFSEAARTRFREQEAAGRVEKVYLAVVRGELREPLTLDRALDTANRRVTRVLSTPAEDPTRVTRVTPLKALPDGTSLVRAEIMRGARHQIRAHLAQAGHPILGDRVYGDAEGGDPTSDGRLMLHHARLVLPDEGEPFAALWLPGWGEAAADLADESGAALIS